MDPDGSTDPKAARRAARQERRARSQQQYELLVSARRERRSGARGTIANAATLRGLPSRRTTIVLLIIGVVGALALTLGGSSSGSPRLTTSCTTPAVVVAAVNGSSSLRYSITGPVQGPYVVTIDAETARVRGAGIDLTPAGATAIAIKKNLRDCKGNGALPAPKTGAHDVVIFLDGRLVARAPISR